MRDSLLKNQTITYKAESPFTVELKYLVNEYLKQDPHGRTADLKTFLKSLFIIFSCISLYITLLIHPYTFIQQILLTLMFALFTLVLGLNVMHESAHGNISKNRWINQIFAFSFDCFGVSSDLYRIKHVQFHHNFTNIFGPDGDISETPLIRMSLQQKHLFLHRFQTVYTPFLYSLITLTWPLSDLSRMIDRKVGMRRFKPLSFKVLFRIIFFKCISILLTYLIPMHQLGVKRAFILILIFHLTLGFVLALTFQIAHVLKETAFSKDSIDTDWFIHQIQTTADFKTDNAWINSFFGGLNFQVIHHLFPNVSYRHYPNIQKIVQRCCQKYNVHYTHFEDLSSAILAHFRFLKLLSKKMT